MGVLSNRLFFSDGTSSYVYDGRSVQTWGIARTTVAPTVTAQNVAGSLVAATGVKAAVSWVVLDEAGNRVHESSRTNKNASFVVVGGVDDAARIDITALTPPARATHWSGYMSELDGSEVLRRTNTTAITTLTYDATAFPVATSPKAPVRNDVPPPSTVGTVAKNRVFLRDDASPNTYFFGALGEVKGLLNGAPDESFCGYSSSSISDLVNSDFVPDRELRAIVEHQNNVFLLSETRTFVLLGEMNLLDNRSPRSLVKLQVFTEGAIKNAAVSTPLGLVWMTPGRKIYLWSGGAEIFDVGEPIQPLLDDVEGTDPNEVSIAWYSGNGRRWVVITLESNYGISDSSSLVASKNRALIYDFALPTQRLGRTEPGSWFEWVDNDYIGVGVYEEENGQPVLLLGDKTGNIKQCDTITQPAHLEFTAIPGKTYISNSLSNNPAALFRTGLIRPGGDNWVTGQYVSIHTGTQEAIEDSTTQPTLALDVDAADPSETPGITLTLDTMLTNQERRAYLAAESASNASGALAKSFVLETRYAAGIDTLETNNSRNKGAVNTLHRFAVTYSPQPDVAE